MMLGARYIYHMQLENIQTVGVAGAGVMGHGIAYVAGLAGHKVVLYDPFEESLQKGQKAIERFAQKGIEKGKLKESDLHSLQQRLAYSTDVGALVGDIIIEAIPERLDLKQELFKQLEVQNSPEAILATNTSSIPVSAIAQALEHKQRVVGMHFFNPAPLMKLVEVIAGEETSQQVVQTTLALSKAWGKSPAVVADVPGFIVNRVARHFYLQSLHLAETGAAKPEAVDRLLEGLGFRMGAFRLMDLIGVETNHSVSESLYASFYQAARFKPSRLQQHKVHAGHFGRKSGQGFYRYD